MKVLLAYKPVDEGNDIEKVTTPGGLLSIGAVLNENFIDTKLCNFSYSSWQDVENKIKEFQPNLLGTTCYAFNRHAVFRLAKLAKLINPKIMVVAGGPFATAMPEKILNHCQEIDVIVMGEGENTMLQLIKAFQGRTSLENVKGIAFRKNKEAAITEAQPALDLAKLPVPAKHFKYNHIITSRGCPGQCIFCATPRYWGNKIRYRTADSIAKEFALLKKQGVGDLIISDDSFTADKQQVLEFCRLLLKDRTNVMWDCRSRYNLVDEGRLTAMKRAGCYKIGYGIESGSKKILTTLKKFIAPEQMIKSAKLTRDAGLYQYVFLIVGNPGEDDGSIQETLNLLEQIKPQAVLTSYLHTYPGTELYKVAKENGLSDFHWFKDEEHLPENYVYKFRERKEQLELWVHKVYDFFNQHRNEWRLTEIELKRNIELCPFDVFSMNELAKMYAKNNDFKNAEALLNSAVKINPFFSSTFLNLGILHEKQDKMDDALENYYLAIRANPQNAVAYKNLGNVYCKRNDIPKAITSYESAVLFNYQHKAQLNAIIEHLKG